MSRADDRRAIREAEDLADAGYYDRMADDYRDAEQVAADEANRDAEYDEASAAGFHGRPLLYRRLKK